MGGDLEEEQNPRGLSGNPRRSGAGGSGERRRRGPGEETGGPRRTRLGLLPCHLQSWGPGGRGHRRGDPNLAPSPGDMDWWGENSRAGICPGHAGRGRRQAERRIRAKGSAEELRREAAESRSEPNRTLSLQCH